MSYPENNIEKHCYMPCSGQKIVQALCDCINRLKNRIYIEKLNKTIPPPPSPTKVEDGSVGC
jgi:hypothetical protein